jgi:hypothetical protein
MWLAPEAFLITGKIDSGPMDAVEMDLKLQNAIE